MRDGNGDVHHMNCINFNLDHTRYHRHVQPSEVTPRIEELSDELIAM